MLPARGEFVIRGAYLLTMDAALGDLPRGDVHCKAGVIVAVGAAGLPAPGAAVIDGTGMIVMPGLIDAHTHLWTTQMRGRFGSAPDRTYFRVRNALAEGYRPEDMYCGTRLGAADAISSGITTCVDFCHNNRGPEFVTACLGALRDTGLRCRYLFGAATHTAPTQSIDIAALEQLAHSWQEVAGDAPLSLGLAWRGPLGITTADLRDAAAHATGVARQEFEAARRLELPITLHVSGAAAKAQFDALVAGDFLGPDVQLIHFTDASAADVRIATEAGAAVCLTPLTELRVGYGITRLGDYVAGGMRIGLGIDGGALAGASNLFAVLKLLQLLETGRLQNERAVSARSLLQLATLEGARSIGMDQEIGSLSVGKRADLIMIRTSDLNTGWFAEDPCQLLVEAVAPANVDTVIIEGRILKRQGRMTALEPREVIAAAQTSLANILRRTQPTLQ